MTEDQKDKIAFARRQLMGIVREQKELSEQLDPDKHEPELEKKVFTELSKLSMEAAKCYQQMADSYNK